MNSRKHTPGPWSQSHRQKPNGMYGTEVYDAEGEAIAEVSWYPVPTADGVATKREANAALIAAAPDLLEAAVLLEDAEHNRQFCDECEDEGEPEACGKCFPKFDDARIKRRIAIAKATKV